MLIFTHLMFAQAIFKSIKQSDMDSSILHKNRFFYGNIKPDISPMANCKHHFFETYLIYDFHLKNAMNTDKSHGERSESLGIACHFLCDYFCKYHGKKPFNQEGILSHLWYELKLHFKTHNMLFQSALDVRGIVTNTHMDLIQRLSEYHSEEEGLGTDISYALSAMNFAMGQVLNSQVIKEDKYEVSHLYRYVSTTS